MNNQETQGQPLSRKKRAVFSLILLLIPLLLLALAYVGYSAYRTRTLYFHVKNNQAGWKGNLYHADPILGFAPVPGSQGEIVLPIGPNVPAAYDEDGFRKRLDTASSATRDGPVLLTLGGSFTFGAATLAKDTFPELAAEALGGAALNAGVPSYGLSQVMIRAGELIPLYQPDYVIVQYSPWLVDRAVSPFAPTYFGRLPTPYFYQAEPLALHRPVFRPALLDLPIDQFRNPKISVSDFLSFFWRVGLPLSLHDDANMALYALKRAVGVLPNPTSDREAVTGHVYAQIAEAAQANDAALIILVLGIGHEEVAVPEELLPPEAVIVNAHALLLERLATRSEASYRENYAHWRGTPPELVDLHPNEKAHAIIAEALVAAIEEIKSGPGD